MHDVSVMLLLGLLGEDAAKFVQIHLLNEEVLEAAVTVQRLLRRRANLKDLNHKLQVSHELCGYDQQMCVLCKLFACGY